MSPATEQLTIEGFAEIKHLDLEIRPFTVLIGPQSVGKSIVAKLLFFFKGAPRNLYLAALRDEGSTAAEALLDRFAKILPAPSHPGGTARITYSIHDLEFVVEHGKESRSSWKMLVPRGLQRAYARLATELQEDDGEEGISEANDEAKDVYLSSLDKLWPGSTVPPRFVPAGRSFFSQIERDVAAYLETASSLDPFVAEFWKFLSLLKNPRRFAVRPRPENPASLIAQELLSGVYKRTTDREEFIQTLDGRKLPPRLWSSGQQEVQPLALLLQRYYDGNFSPGSLFIEEPEAHLFPTSQRLITELIAMAYNAREPNMEIFLTTHSPYILTTINNLLLAGQLYHRELSAKKQSALAEIVPEDRALTPGQVGAFYMDRSGGSSIIDAKTNLIDASAIDQVSNGLNDQFDALLNFEPA